MATPARASLLLVPLLLLACGDDLGPRVPAAIVVTPEAPRVIIGGTLQLAAVVMDAMGREIEGHAITFQSSDRTVLTVDDAGLLTSIGPTGTSLIIAASGDISAEVEAAVVLPPSALVVSPRSLELDDGEPQFLSFFVTDENGDPVPTAHVTFESSDPAVVLVEEVDWSDELVLVTGLAVGTATITLTSGELTAEVPVTVARYPHAVVLTPSSLVLSPGGSQQVTVALLDRTGEELETPQPFIWSSGDETVVTVSQTGLVTSLGAEGTAVITATVDTFTASLGVFVGTPPAGEILSRLPLQLAEGVAVAPDGQYFVAGFHALARGALPELAFSVQVPLIAGAEDIVLDASVTRAYLIGATAEVNGVHLRGVVLIDLATNAQVDFIPVSSGGLTWTGALSNDGSRLFVGTDRGLEVIDLASKASLGVTPVGSIARISHHPSRPLLYASGEAGVLELDAMSGAVTRRFPGGVLSHVVAPDGARLYTVGFDGGVGVWNLETGSQERTLADVSGNDIAITPDGKFLYVLRGSDYIVGGSLLYIIDPASGIRVRTVTLGGLALRMAMSSDGIAVISNYGGPDGWVDFVR